MLTMTAALRRTALSVFCSAALLAQTKPVAPDPPKIHEFPVELEQKIIAGTTAVGTKVRATLSMATLMDGTVFPKNAVFSGEVTESVAKSKTAPARLGVCMDSVQWKNGSATVKVYVTAWYYPTTVVSNDDLQYGPTKPASKTWNGAGAYPDSNQRDYKPFPGPDSDSQKSAPDISTAVTAHHRTRMKNVESVRSSDGRVSLTSSHSNLKLDKLTTYVLATDDLQAPK